MNLPTIPSSLATGAGALLSGAPWWAVLLGAAVIIMTPPILAQARAWAQDRSGRKLQEEFIAVVRELPDAEKKVQAIIEYRKADAPGTAESGTQEPPSEPQNSPAAPQGP